jgi:predicted histidine transporter YuiF (NhaC family)
MEMIWKQISPPQKYINVIVVKYITLIVGYGNIKKNIINESIKKENMIVDEPSMKNLILDIIKNNTDALKEIMDVCKNMNNTTNNNISNTNNTNNSNNKTFNLQVFLNEQCKDAVNLSDFISSIELNLSDLENMEKLGYTDCMIGRINILLSKIMIRPIMINI